MNDLRKEIAETIGINLFNSASDIEFQVLESIKEDGYTRQLIKYDSNGDLVSAFLLIPEKLGNNPAILINH